MREAVDAGIHEIDRIDVIEDVRVHLQPALVSLVDDRAIQRRRQLRRATVPIVDPDLDDVDVASGELLNGLARFGNGRHLVRHAGIRRSAGTGVRRSDAATGEQEPRRRRQFPCLLIGAHLIHHVTRLNPLRLHNGDAEVERAIEIVDDGLRGVVLAHVGGAALKARMHVRGHERRHHGLARQIDAVSNCRPDRPRRSDLRNLSALHHDRGAFDDR